MANCGWWKEGRVCGATLCYIAPRPEQLDWIIEHHAAVGIRATLAGGDEPHRQLLAERNWHLTGVPASDGMITWHDGEAAGVMRRLSLALGAIADPASLTDPLPSQPANDVAELRATIESDAGSGAWRIWRMDEATLEAIGPADHRALLQWLGENHARIWCAPAADIAAWCAAS
jgi:hypothetical protein